MVLCIHRVRDCLACPDCSNPTTPGDRTPTFALDSVVLFLTVRKVLHLSRKRPKILFLQVLLRDAIWAFALIWGSRLNGVCAMLQLISPHAATMALSEIFLIINRPDDFAICGL
jgi:hypothetical protein